jgi:hypothetical protein
VLVVELDAVGGVVDVTVAVVEVRAAEVGAEDFELGLLPHPLRIIPTRQSPAIATIRVDTPHSDGLV